MGGGQVMGRERPSGCSTIQKGTDNNANSNCQQVNTFLKFEWDTLET